MAESSSLGTRYFARSGVPSARLVIQRLGRGLGVSSRRRGNFRPLVSRGSGFVHQRQRALSCRKSSSLLCSATFKLHSGHVRGQLYGDRLPSQPGGHLVSAAQLHFSAYPAVGGVSTGSFGAAIHNGSQQCHSGFPVQTQSDLGVGVDPEGRGFSRSAEEVASVHRPVRNLTKSPMLPIFFSVPRSERFGHRCSAPELEWVAGVCLSSLVSHSGSTEEALVVIWSPPDHHSSLLAPEAMVPGASRSGGGRSSSSSTVSRPPEAAALPSSSSGSVRAVSSCVETIQRFARSQGFSAYVAKQSSLARRSSSKAGYQAKWSIYRQWCRSEGHSISPPSLPKVVDFLFWLCRSKKLSVSAVLVYRSMLSAVFRSQLPEISTSLLYRISCVPLKWRLLAVQSILLPGI